MATVVPGKDISATLAAAQSWIERCLIRDGSIVSDDRIWTTDSLSELRARFIDHPLGGEGRYFEKLKEQIRECSAPSKRLMAEMLWIARLFPSNVSATTKRKQVIEVYATSGIELQPDYAILADGVLGGIGSAGPGYNNHFWRELVFIITLTESIKTFDEATRERTLKDYAAFMAWIEAVPQEGQRQFRHMLRYFAFPDRVERMSSNRERRQVVSGFRGLSPADMRNWGDRELDGAVLEIRKEAEAQHSGQSIDFYQSPLRERWIADEAEDADEDETDEASPVKRAWLLTWNPRKWAWADFHRQLERTNAGEVVRDRWSCTSAKPRVGDDMWLVRLGVHPRAIIGRGRIASAPYDAPHWDQERAEKGEVTQFVDVDLLELRDPEGDQTVLVDELMRRAGDEQRWMPQQSGIAIKPRAATALEALWTAEATQPDRSAAKYMVREQNVPTEPYSIEDALFDLFMPRGRLEEMLGALRRKKNVILQGPPGVGKTYVARRLAYCLMGEKAPDRVEMVQFHQAYSYEDFIQGYRPTGSGFSLRDGTFHQFASRVQKDPSRAYVFIIDEINRGNLSKVMGELMMLIESDKRGPAWAMPLAYAQSANQRFYIPENLYLVGLMNTADRSLAMVDYALRRRFAFIDVPPCFDTDAFRGRLMDSGASRALVEKLCVRMKALNQEIADDKNNLGPGFCIGHSFFSPNDDSETPDDAWYARIIRDEIAPLLREYWFDDAKRADEWTAILLA